MAFWGSSFLFNGIPSDLYNVYISSPDGGEVNTNGSSNVELYTQAIYRRPVPYLYGASQSPVLEFDVNITSPSELMAVDARLIQRWLFGHSSYKKLQIIQDDLDNLYFNCFLTNPQMIRVGNKIQGFSMTVVCDAPWGWEYPIIKTFTLNEDDPIYSFSIYNSTDNNAYTYPLVSFSLGTNNSAVVVRNLTDSNRETIFDELLSEEIITIDNDRNILTSSTGLYRLGYFNKKWIRLLQGVNYFELEGFLTSFSMTYSPARKIGG